MIHQPQRHLTSASRNNHCEKQVQQWSTVETGIIKLEHFTVGTHCRCNNQALLLVVQCWAGCQLMRGWGF